MASKFTEDNRRFFDDLAAKYDIKPWQRDLSEKITTYMQSQLDFIGIPASPSPSSLLDYACGTGMITRALGPYIDSIQAIDLSTNMVSRYQELAASSDVPSVKAAKARVGNLLIDQQEGEGQGDEELKDFSIAAVGLGVHHFADPGLAIKKLASRLRLGGVLLIVDFVEEKGNNLPSPAEHTIHKHGFTEIEMLGLMVDAGLVDFDWREMPGKVELKMCEERPVYRRVFLAKAVRTY